MNWLGRQLRDVSTFTVTYCDVGRWNRSTGIRMVALDMNRFQICAGQVPPSTCGMRVRGATMGMSP